MANIWKQNKDVSQHPNRNNFDLSYCNHLTMKMGYLYPVFKRRVYPGDSFRISSAFDLKLMPLAFPVQSRFRAHMHFFYCRNKNLWSGWEDWIEGLRTQSETPHPYIAVSDSKVKTGSIYDYLGVPTTLVTRSSVVERSSFLYSVDVGYPLVFRTGVNQSMLGEPFRYKLSPDTTYKYPSFVLTSPVNYVASEYILRNAQFYVEAFTALASSGYCFFLLKGSSFESSVLSYYDLTGQSVSCALAGDSLSFSLSDELVEYLRSVVLDGDNYYFVFSTLSPQSGQFSFLPAFEPSFEWVAVGSSGFYQYSDLSLGYYKNHQYLNALPFRAYESIYYAYYANNVLQPLLVNGRKEYNKFNTTTADGVDLTDYHLFKRNYELDFLTSALPSPQAGPAPLVGMSALGDITVEDENGVTTAKAVLDSDGNVTKVAVTSPLASVDHARTLMNIASVGMNINDFRSVNALQRFLEQTLRSGYRYMDFVRGQFGKEPKYRELDMPEFIGGYSRDVQINTVVSQADTLGIAGETSGANLGDFVGNGRVVGGSNHDVSHYCDDFGWIIGILCVTPTPAYSQLLDKSMLAPTSNLDYAFPLMSQIGMQGITYREVMPLQAFVDSIEDDSKSVDDVFGYQRPNYDEVASVDEVHGEYRSTLRNFLVNRIFDGRPELGSDFLEIDPEEVNDIFANTNPDDDTIIGQLAFRVFCKRPFPRVHVPGLGR